MYYHGCVFDDRLKEDANVAITSFCHEFAEHFAELPYYFIMPLFEAMTSFIAVMKQIGIKPALLMSTVVFSSILVLQKLSPPFGRIHASLLEREDEFRKLHMQVSTNCEQIALYNAGSFMQKRLNTSFSLVFEGMKHIALARGHFELIQSSISTCVWEVVGWLICERVIRGAKTQHALLSSVVVQRRLISDFHHSVASLAVNFREISHFSEYTEKLAAFDNVLEEIARSHLENSVHLQGQYRVENSSGESTLENSMNLELSLMGPRALSQSVVLIEFKNMSISAPNGALLISGLTLKIRKGEDWVITGPNGCGKSSVLRVLSQLWYPTEGSFNVHPDVDLLFVPQQAYMVSNCTLCEQITFPDVLAEENGPLNSDWTNRNGSISYPDTLCVKEALEHATGGGIVEEVLGDWYSNVVGFHLKTADRSFDWSSLSGGQQQKLALARVFYHAHKSAEKGRIPIVLMDESMSQIDREAVTQLFDHLNHAKIQIISVSHRTEVTKKHNNSLKLTHNPKIWYLGLSYGFGDRITFSFHGDDVLRYND